MKGGEEMNQLADWMYHAIEESFTCQFASTTARDIPVAPLVFLHFFLGSHSSLGELLLQST